MDKSIFFKNIPWIYLTLFDLFCIFTNYVMKVVNNFDFTDNVC